MDAIKKMFEVIRIRVKLGQKRGEAISSVNGIKQGDPLSPLLFGLFIEILGDMLDLNAPNLGIPVFHLLIKALFYADDVTLTADSPEQLQSLLDVVSEFCDMFGMTVNTSKTVVIVFRQARHKLPTPKCKWFYKGVEVPMVTSVSILGVRFDSVGLVQPWKGPLLDSCWKALFGLQRILQYHDLYGPEVKLRMFNSRVKSTMLYGSQIWGADFITTDPLKAMKNPFMLMQLSFLRFVTGASKSVDKQVLLDECGQQPLPCLWLQILCRFWNNLAEVENGTISNLVFKDNVRLANLGCVSCWSSKVWNLCHNLDPILFTSTDVSDNMHLNDKELAVAIGGKLCPPELTPSDPRAAPSKGIAKCIYNAWFRTDRLDSVPTHITCLDIPEKHHTTLMRFRIGCGKVATNTGRCCLPKDKIPRCERTCKFPGCSGVEDEFHVVIECKAYDSLRSRPIFRPLFASTSAADMKTFMNGTNQSLVAQFLYELFAARTHN